VEMSYDGSMVAYLVAANPRKVREALRKASRAPKPVAKPMAALIQKKTAEIEQLRQLMKAGTLSPAVAEAAIQQAEGEIRNFGSSRRSTRKRRPASSACCRVPPRSCARESAAEMQASEIRAQLRRHGTRCSRCSAGRVPLRRAEVKAGTKPYLIARVALNREVLLQVPQTVSRLVAGA
jgi:hypothetical protein